MTYPNPAPWAPGEHPADWAYRTGRVTAKSREWWRARYANDEVGVAATLVGLYPILAALPGDAPTAAQAAEDAEFADLFPPTTREAPDMGEFTDLFPPTRW